MELVVNDSITWESAAGKLTGTIKSIRLAPSAARTITPWIVIAVPADKNRLATTIQLCGSDSYLKTMRVVKIQHQNS